MRKCEIIPMNRTNTAMLYAYLRLMRMHRPIGAFLLLWPTLWALWLAGSGQPSPTVAVIFIAGVFAMRAAGCVLNDYADRNIDPHVQRTCERPLARGELSVRQAVGLLAGLLLCALALVLQLNRYAQLLSLFAVFIAALYPFTKRFTHLPQLFLGVAFSMGIPMAYAALTEALPMEAWLLFAANFAWVVAYDTQYAMVDRDDDIRIGVQSTAILFGKYDNIIVGLLHLACLSLLALLGWQRALSWHFHLGLGLALLFAIYQQTMCKHRDRARCLRAFHNNNWFGAMVFCGVVLGLLGEHS